MLAALVVRLSLAWRRVGSGRSVGPGRSRGAVVAGCLGAMLGWACALSSTPPASPDAVGPETGQDHAVVMLTAGQSHVCALRRAGGVWCWGSNESGQRGDGRREAALSATRVIGIGDAVEIAAGDRHTCARRRGGSVMCWGDGARGQLGGPVSPSPSRPRLVSGVSAATGLVVGGDQSCAWQSGRLMCWGSDLAGQLGGPASGTVSAPRPLSAVRAGEQLAFGRAHACVLRGDGSLLCWGDNRAGQLGDGTQRSRARPARVRALTGASVVAAFADRSCAAAGSTVYCWGRSAQTGDAQLTPKRVDLPGRVRELELGQRHTCAGLEDGAVVCWGSNERGQLATGDLVGKGGVVRIGGVQGARDLAVVTDASCVLTGASDVRCWGSDAHGALGNGAPAGAAPYEPARVSEVANATGVATGDEFTCAVSRGGTVYCWGRDRYGQLGDGPSTLGRRTPHAVAGLREVASIAAGAAHACAVDRGGGVHCWGDNRSGQALPGGGKRVDKPRRVRDLPAVQAVALGRRHSCALKRDGTVSCWGDRPGRGVSAPTAVAGLRGIAELAAGDRHTCARAATGRTWCWGENLRGQIGDGAGAGALDEPALLPRAVARLDDASALAGGGSFGCAVRRGGKVSCWGDNGARQLGSGTASDVWTTPVPVRRLSGMQGIDSGIEHSCAFGQGSVVCWGRGEQGQLGVDQPQQPEPGAKIALDAVELAAGARHTCARLRDGAIACWGDDAQGQLGLGARGPALRPQRVRGL
ncbi:MAG: RCC1 repeat-containing protein [Myxococcales bacterium FL481]|nr:MAG: RCC1 repeat-containing protein [Myxococcales bacterium FL481]